MLFRSEVLAGKDELFEQININLPPVVVLSKEFKLEHISYNVEDFTEQICQLAAKQGREV